MLKPWKELSTFQTVFMRSIEKLKKHLVKVSFFLVRFFWRGKKNEYTKSNLAVGAPHRLKRIRIKSIPLIQVSCFKAFLKPSDTLFWSSVGKRIDLINGHQIIKMFSVYWLVRFFCLDFFDLFYFSFCILIILSWLKK